MTLVRSDVNECKKRKSCVIMTGIIWFISCTWGGMLSFCGIIVMTFLLCRGYKPKGYMGFVYFEVGKRWGGINLGPVFVVNRYASEHILKHELGHGLQNIVYGWLMPFLVAIPSVSRARWRQRIYSTDYARYIKLPKYEDVWFERQATEWGYRFCEHYVEK